MSFGVHLGSFAGRRWVKTVFVLGPYGAFGGRYGDSGADLGQISGPYTVILGSILASPGPFGIRYWVKSESI